MAKITITLEDKEILNKQGAKEASVNIQFEPPGKLTQKQYKESPAWQCFGTILVVLQEELGVDITPLETGDIEK